MLPASRLETFAAFVHVGIDRFGEHQALVDVVDVDTSGRFVQQRLVVRGEVVSKQRELEATTPLERTVARSAVTAESS